MILFVVVQAVASCGRMDFQTRSVVDDASTDVGDAPIDVACGAVQDQTVACPVYDTGTMINERTYNCSVGDWSAWTELTDTCVCVGGSQTQTLACPVGQSGEMVETQTYSCATMTWSAWVVTSDTCS